MSLASRAANHATVVLAALGAAALLALGGCTTASNTGACNLAFMGSLPLSPFRGHATLHATIDEQPVTLIFDTGAFSTVLTPAAAERLHLRPDDMKVGPMEGIGGRRTIAVYRARSVRLGKLQARSYPFAVSDVGAMVGPSVDGLIGMDFFRYQDLDIDLPARRLNLYQPQHDCTHPSAYMHGPLYTVPLLGAEPGRAYASDSADSQPRIHVTVQGITLNATLDTGAPHSVLFSRGADRLHMDEHTRQAGRVVRAAGVGPRTLDAPVIDLDAVTIGDLELRNLRVALISQDMADGPDMLLGLDFFEHVHLWISHSSGALIMQYPPQASPLDPAAFGAR